MLGCWHRKRGSNFYIITPKNFSIEGYGFMNQCTHEEDVCEDKNDYDGLISRLANTFPNLRELDVSRARIDSRVNSIRELRVDLPNCEVIAV